MKNEKFGFFEGIMFSLAVTTLVQDIMGRSRYIDYITNHWVDWWISTPLALIVLIFVVRQYFLSKEK